MARGAWMCLDVDVRRWGSCEVAQKMAGGGTSEGRENDCWLGKAEGDMDLLGERATASAGALSEFIGISSGSGRTKGPGNSSPCSVAVPLSLPDPQEHTELEGRRVCWTEGGCVGRPSWLERTSSVVLTEVRRTVGGVAMVAAAAVAAVSLCKGAREAREARGPWPRGGGGGISREAPLMPNEGKGVLELKEGSTDDRRLPLSPPAPPPLPPPPPPLLPTVCDGAPPTERDQLLLMGNDGSCGRNRVGLSLLAPPDTAIPSRKPSPSNTAPGIVESAATVQSCTPGP